MRKHKVVYHFTSRTALNRAVRNMNDFCLVVGLDMIVTQRNYNRNKFINQHCVYSALN